MLNLLPCSAAKGEFMYEQSHLSTQTNSDPPYARFPWTVQMTGTDKIAHAGEKYGIVSWFKNKMRNYLFQILKQEDDYVGITTDYVILKKLT